MSMLFFGGLPLLAAPNAQLPHHRFNNRLASGLTAPLNRSSLPGEPLFRRVLRAETLLRTTCGQGPRRILALTNHWNGIQTARRTHSLYASSLALND